MLIVVIEVVAEVIATIHCAEVLKVTLIIPVQVIINILIIQVLQWLSSHVTLSAELVAVHSTV